MKEVYEKVFSGRFLLTLACGLVFAYCAIMKILPTDAVVSIITMVFVAYFSRIRPEDKENNNQQQQQTTEVKK